MKIVFFGTGNFATLILKDVLDQADWNLDLVVTENTTSPVGKIAKEKNLPLLEVKTLKDHEVYKSITDIGSDVMVVVDYGEIIPPTIFGYPPFGTINIHPSLLPKLRGPSPIQYALLRGQEKTGVSLMVIDDKVDHGALIAKEELDIKPDDTYLTLEKKLATLGVKLLVRELPLYLESKTKPTPQDHQEATFTRKIEKKQGQINWAHSARDIYNMWRAYLRWPGIFTFAKKGEKKIRLNLIKVSLTDINSKQETGYFFKEEGNLFVRCGEGVLKIEEIQPEGKNVLSSGEFINGYSDVIGQTLTNG